jgi:Raf kinase inhibitor-like YbhB/YbcL family protein
VTLKMGQMRLHSRAFDAHGLIPQKNAGYGDNIAPLLEWQDAPKATKSFALICHDPDAPLPRGFTHWVLYNIPASTTSIPEGGNGPFTSGVNSTGKPGYTGPMPPPAHGPHHYYFWLYALDSDAALTPGLDREQCLTAIAEHVIEQARLVGIYERQK